MSNFLKKFGQNIQNLRKFYGLNQEKFAEMIDLDPTTITAIETGKHFVKSSTLEKICIALNVKPSELFDFEISNTEKDNQLLEQIIVRAKNLTQQQQKQVIEILETFKN